MDSRLHPLVLHSPKMLDSLMLGPTEVLHASHVLSTTEVLDPAHVLSPTKMLGAADVAAEPTVVDVPATESAPHMATAKVTATNMAATHVSTTTMSTPASVTVTRLDRGSHCQRQAKANGNSKRGNADHDRNSRM